MKNRKHDKNAFIYMEITHPHIFGYTTGNHINFRGFDISGKGDPDQPTHTMEYKL